MPPIPKRRDHVQVEKDSQRNLAGARRAKANYNSSRTRSAMATAFLQRSKGKTARPWQLDAAESFLLGLDTVIIAGTGAGKTAPFMLPLLLPENKDRILVVIEPLINLQRDQVSNHMHVTFFRGLRPQSAYRFRDSKKWEYLRRP